MLKKTKISLLILGLFALRPGISHADSLMANREIGESFPVYEKNNGSFQNIGTIDDLKLYDLEGEEGNFYKIKFEDKDAYVDKDNFYKLSHTGLVEDAKLFKEADESSKSVDLKKNTKVTILDFVGIDDFVKVSYEEDRFENSFLNVKKKKEDDLVFRMLTGDEPEIETETIGPETVTIGEDEAEDSKEKIGYIHFKDLAISYRSQEMIDDFIGYYDRLNESRTYVRNTRSEQIFDNVASYEEPITYDSFEGTKALDTIDVHMRGSEVGIDLYSYAVNFLGNPYVFGGEDLYNGIDCSGFTMRVYETVGVGLPHYAQSQQRYGVEIPFGQEEAGDLVFFGTSLSNITHVGIADGYGNMVHASSPSTGIIISPIYNPISIKRLVY